MSVRQNVVCVTIQPSQTRRNVNADLKFFEKVPILSIVTLVVLFEISIGHKWRHDSQHLNFWVTRHSLSKCQTKLKLMNSRELNTYQWQDKYWDGTTTSLVSLKTGYWHIHRDWWKAHQESHLQRPSCWESTSLLLSVQTVSTFVIERALPDRRTGRDGWAHCTLH